MVSQIQKEVAQDLHDFFDSWLRRPNSLLAKSLARKINSNYITASPLLDSYLYSLVSDMTNFFVPTGIKPPAFEEIKTHMSFLEDKYGTSKITTNS